VRRFQLLLTTSQLTIGRCRLLAFEAVTALYEEEIPGFGEIFRMLSYREVGSAAMLSRASAGVVRGRPVFSLPGSEAAVGLALRRLILPELSHLAYELSKPGGAR